MNSNAPQAETCHVVGGGMLGMTVALRLAEAGHRVTIHEAASHLGGLADAWQLGDITWDRHYHVTLLSDAPTRAILRQLDLEQTMEWVETKTGFFTNGELYSMSNLLEFLRFPPLSLINKLRLGWTIFYGSKIKNWRSMEKISVAKWLKRWSGEQTFEKFWLPLLRSKLGENYRITSAAFIWATIKRLYAARRTGLKREMFGYVPGGYDRIGKRFAEKLSEAGVDVRLNQAVERIEAVERDTSRITFRSGKTVDSRRTVLTIPSGLMGQVCEGLADNERQRHAEIEYQGIICASFLLRRPLGGFYVTNITEEDMPFTGVIEMTTLVDPKHVGGHTLVYLPKYVPSDDPAFEMSDDEVHRQCFDGLRKMYRELSESDIVAFRVSRVRHVMPIPTINYSQKLPPVKTSLPGVWSVNSAQIVNGTLNVNETVRLAEEFVEQVFLPAIRSDDSRQLLNAKVYC